MRARRVLDQVQTRAQLAGLAATPSALVEALAGELSGDGTLAELEARDGQLQAALTDIDAMIARAMRIELDHALADDTSIATPTRKVFATTVVRYARDRELLAARAREQAVRGGARDPDAIATAVVNAADTVLTLWAHLRSEVLALVRDRYTVSATDALRRATDRQLEDAHRTRWSAARRELEATAADPLRITTDTWAARLATWPAQLDEPTPAPELSFADLIELD